MSSSDILQEIYLLVNSVATNQYDGQVVLLLLKSMAC